MISKPGLDPILHPLRKLEEATLHVGRHTLVNLLRVGEAQTLHDLDELLHLLGQPGVVELLLPHGRHHHALREQSSSRHYYLVSTLDGTLSVEIFPS